MPFLMLTHLNSVTGVPVCAYLMPFGQPLRSEFGRFPSMPCTVRQFSECQEKTYYSVSLRLYMLRDIITPGISGVKHIFTLSVHIWAFGVCILQCEQERLSLR